MSNLDTLENCNTSGTTETLDTLRSDISLRQKKGLPFILSSVIIWSLILVSIRLGLTQIQKDFLVFCCSCPLMPLAVMIGKLIRVSVFDKSNPLGKLGFLFTLNQMLYLLIVMWIMNFAPEKMVIAYAMVFGGHLLPFSWLYKSKAYAIFSIAITIGALIVGLRFGESVLALVMVVTEILLSVCLFTELRKV